MSRYRATTGELLEQVRQEAKMKDIYGMAFDGDSAQTIAKKLKLDVATVKKVLGERFSMSDFKSNEYYNLLGGDYFEPTEENPMIGWRGASRYYSEEYEYAFV